MARRRNNDRTFYLVTWDAEGIIKLGFTDHLRRRRKAFPGARLVLALTFPDSLTGYDFEIAANRAAFGTWPRAFASREEAAPYLPPSGRGYLECYRTTPGEALELIASQCHITVSRHNVTPYRDDALSRHSVTSRSYGRTDGLTENCGDRDAKICGYVTRVRARQNFRVTGFGWAS
jgi:hypothetical protein